MAIKRRRGQIRTKNTATANEKITTKTDFAKFKKYYVYFLLVVLAGLPFIVGKYIEFNTAGPFDSGSYVYSAQRIANGAKLFVDEMPSAQPMTLLINFIGVKLFGFSETGPIFMQALLQLAAFAMMFIAIRKMYGLLPAIVSVVLASVYLSAPLVAKFGNVKEQFMVSFMVITASCFILRQLGGKWWWSLLTGAFAVNIYYFKQTGVSVIVALLLYMLVSVIIIQRKWRLAACDFLLILAGACVGLLPLYIFYSWQNVTPYLLKTVPAYTLINLLKLIVIAAGLYVLVRLAMYLEVVKHLKKIRQVRRSIWLAAIIAIAVVFVPCAYFYHTLVIVDVELLSDGVARQVEDVQKQGYMNYHNPEQVAAELKAIENLGYMDYYKSLSKRDISLKRGGELNSYFFSIALVKYPKMIVGYPLNIIKSTYDRFATILAKAIGTEGYIGASRQTLDLKEQSKKVFGFYRALKLPISMAATSLIAGVIVLILRVLRKKKQTTISDHLVFFMAIWWVLDMLFVWISPRSYEQYYLPLIASASVLAAYICSFYSTKLIAAKSKFPWYGAGALTVIIMLAMTWQIFFGLIKSPHTGREYDKADSSRKGYAQALKRVADSKDGKIGPWEKVAAYINERTDEDDTIYVWGWYPGIYVKAQRLSTAKKAFESEMHVRPPEILEKTNARLVRSFEKNPPKYIVDSRKSHFPWNRPPLELWPAGRGGLIPNQKPIVERFNKDYSKMLADQIGDDEAARYHAMSAFREFVMDNYEIAEPNHYYNTNRGYAHKLFGIHRVFKLKQQQVK